jgi:hypothetical protein
LRSRNSGARRSRAIWIHIGDFNTKFFHKFASFRRNSKYFWEIQDEAGHLHCGQENIKKVALKHFKDFYKEQLVPSTNDRVRVVALFSNMLNDKDVEALYKPVDKEELKKVLTNFKVDKSLGPDGWTIEFFKHLFDIVGEDLLEMVEESRIKGFILGALNSTFITLIPKVKKPHLFGDYRPISLCNLCYKIISKIIVDQIKLILSISLSEEQMGFLQGRQI